MTGYRMASATNVAVDLPPGNGMASVPNGTVDRPRQRYGY
jgi:hypothetical protein